jgi:hypothetical protein
VEKAIERATQAITTLEDAIKADGGREADLTVVRLAVEQARDLAPQMILTDDSTDDRDS